MLINLSGPHILRLILSWSIFYYVLNLTYHTRFPDKIRLQKYTLLVFISVILHLFLAGFALPIIFVIIYWQLHSKENNYYLINLIILNLLVKLLAVLIPTPLIMLLFPTGFDNYACSLTVGLLEFILSVAFVYFYNYFNLTAFFINRHNAIIGILIGYLYVALYMALILLQHFQTYTTLITGILIFVLIQLNFIVFIFIKAHRKRQEIYQDQFSKEQVHNLKLYTDQLESDQLKLRHFKHDYKNLLFSLKTVVQEKSPQAINQALDNLENYSDDYLNNLSMDLYQDLNNVKNPYLKSLFISKLRTINQADVTVHFTCAQKLSEVPINILDLIKLLNQAIDNAITDTQTQTHGEIQLSIIQEDQQLAFLINNTLSNLPTTKMEKDYLELLPIKELKKQYSNLFIQHSKNAKWFRFHITLIKGAR